MDRSSSASSTDVSASFAERLRAFFSRPAQASAAPAEAPTDDPLSTGEGSASAALAPSKAGPLHADPAEALRLLGTLTTSHLDDARSTAALAATAGTQAERAALRAVLAATEAGMASEALREAAAALFVVRGEHGSARRLLADARGKEALVRRAEAEERDGEPALARATLERVLALDIDAVGVRDRLERLRRAAGIALHLPAGELPTLVTADAANASFRIVSEVGRGGAAAVFRAEDLRLGRTLALKVYHRPREHRGQLQREAELAVRARGPGVVRVFDVDPDQGFLALELAGGGALRRQLRGTKQERAAAAPRFPWLGPLQAALARVHGLGLVHGDVKAGNVLFRTDFTPLLADFGLSRAIGERYEGGTPGTLSPERTKTGTAHPDDDVFALGVLLREALLAWPDQATPALHALAARWTLPRGARPANAGELQLER